MTRGASDCVAGKGHDLLWVQREGSATFRTNDAVFVTDLPEMACR